MSLPVDSVREVLTSFLATVNGQGDGRLLGMHVTYSRLFEFQGSVVDIKADVATITVDFAGLVALMHPDDQDAMHAVLAAAIAARA